jgi:hypothetical protein
MTQIRTEVSKFPRPLKERVMVRGALVVPLVVGLVLVSGCKRNHAPDTLAAPFGTNSTLVGCPCAFEAGSWDPDDDSLAIRFDWGDGDTSDWSTFQPSFAQRSMSHAWSSAGTFLVRYQAKDVHEAVSSWSDGHAMRVANGWSRTFGGPSGECGSCLDQTQDGGYIITGYTYSYGAGDHDLWLVKTDARGETAWTRTYGGTDHDEGRAVQQTQDGGYIVAGSTESFAAGRKAAWLIKTNAYGDTLWTKTYGGWYNFGFSVQQTRDGGYILAGGAESGNANDAWLAKLDADGNVTWNKTYGGAGYEGIVSVRQTQDCGYIVAGYTSSFGAGGYDVWLIKTDSSGDSVWTRTYGGTGEEEGYSVQQTRDGGYAISGCTDSYGAGVLDAWLIKTDTHGDTIWTRTYGSFSYERGWSVQQTPDDGYIIAGYMCDIGAGGGDVWVVKTDASGNKAWDLALGGTSDDLGYSVQQTKDGGYVVVGTTESFGAGGEDVWLIKLDSEGKVDKGDGK